MLISAYSANQFFFPCLLQERIAKMKKEGTYLTKAQKQQRARAQAMLEAMQKQGNDNSYESGLSSDKCIDDSLLYELLC